jgi:hypothetical protein
MSMKTLSLIRSIERDLDAGHAAVIQIVSTGEALMERRLAEIPTEEWGDVQVDITPREYVLDYLAQYLPKGRRFQIEFHSMPIPTSVCRRRTEDPRCESGSATEGGSRKQDALRRAEGPDRPHCPSCYVEVAISSGMGLRAKAWTTPRKT